MKKVITYTLVEGAKKMDLIDLNLKDIASEIEAKASTYFKDVNEDDNDFFEVTIRVERKMTKQEFENLPDYNSKNAAVCECGGLNMNESKNIPQDFTLIKKKFMRLLRETVMRTRLTFPENKEDLKWYNDGRVESKSGDFMERLIIALELGSNIEKISS